LSQPLASPSPERSEPESPQASAAVPARHPRQPHAPLGRKGLAWVLIAAVLALAAFFAVHHLDETLRRHLEATINQKLHGYHVTLGHAHFGLVGLSLILEDVVIRQDANPQPPVAEIPRLKTGLEWSSLLKRHLVADAVFFRPRVHVNLPQLEREAKDPVKMKDRGWQQAFESLYPFKFNRIEVREGDLVYIDTDPTKPLHVSRWNALASNIRNFNAHDRPYPSPIHTDGVVFDTGRAFVDGNADFLAVPYPGVHAIYRVENVPLNRLRPIIAKAELTLTGGTLTSQGEVEYGPRHREARIADVTVRGLRLDYTHTPARKAIEKAAGQKVKKVAENPQPDMPVAVRHLRLVDGNLALVTPIKDHRFRFFVDRANLDVTNISSGFRQGPTHATLTGRFLGTGSAHGSATFHDPRRGADFDLLLGVDNASLPAINDLLRAYGKLDVAQGKLSVYTEIKVHDGRIAGYVKPLIEDLQVYDAKQDQNKPVLKKLYEKVVGGVAHLLENHKDEKVATVADLSGPLSSPNASTWEIIVNLVSNAFVKAILPGFDHELSAYKAAHGKR
jgi:hypothetical protein